MEFVYTIVLYVLININDEDSEIIKLKFRGKGRGNLFNYQKKIFKDYRLNLPQVITDISTYLEVSYGKHAVAFSVALNEDGQPKRPINEEQIKKEMENLLEGARTKLSLLIAPNETNILRLKDDNTPAKINKPAEPKSPIKKAEEKIQKEAQTTTSTSLPTQEDLPPIEVYEKEASSDKIKVEDIPIK
jgi:hypothetical protein